jgi:hypothetical protein
MGTQQRARTLLLSFILLVTATSTVEAQTRDEGPWWPHPIWGADDQAGGSNWITPEKILEAISLVQTGKLYELGHVYERGMPLIGPRTYSMFIPSFPTHGPFAGNVVGNDEFLCAEIGQVGTQFDGPGHVGKRMAMEDGSTADVFYNGIPYSEMNDPFELRKLGVEHVKPFITRGILIDVAGYFGVETLANGYEVTLADVRGALERQGMADSDINPGDALLFNFGWWRHWPDAERFNTNWPGVGDEVAAWIVEREASMVGSDAATDIGLAVHEEVTLKNGIFNLEFMNFEELLADEVREFLFIFTPLHCCSSHSPSPTILAAWAFQ